jgi:hypothetical protein
LEVRAAEELLGVTHKLKQLWILSEAKEENSERQAAVDRRLEVGDVAKELSRILRKDGDVEMEDVQGDTQEEEREVIAID